MIQINPLKSYIDGGVRAAITSPPAASLVFDLPGRAIWVKGVKLKGTDHTYTFNHDNYINLTNTPGPNNSESEEIKIGININKLKAVIDTTYGVVTSTVSGLAPKFSNENKSAASAATTYHFLGWAGTTLKWYQAPWRNVRINAETTDCLGVNSTDPLIISAGNGINVTWDSTNKKIVITNSKPDVNHNTDNKVAQAVTTLNKDYSIILKGNDTDDGIIAGVNFSTYLKFNPSSKQLKINGNRVITIADTFTGATSSTDGTVGLVTKPLIANRNLFLRGDGTWATPTDTNTWRPVKVEGTEKLGSAINTSALDLSAGNGISIVYNSDTKKVIITNTKPDVNHNTHYTTMMYIGENNDIKANKQVGNPYLKLFDDNARRTTFQIKGGTGITVGSDANGNITITNSAPDINHNTDEKVKLTPKTDNVNRPLMMINGGTSLGEQINTSMFSTGIYANASTKMITANGFIKAGSSDSYVLLGGGGHKVLSDFAMASNYVKKAGDTMTGDLFLSNPSGGNSPKLYFHRGPNTSWAINVETGNMKFRELASNKIAFSIYENSQGATAYIYDQEVIHSGNIGSQSVNYANSAGNSDTVDGYHASSLVKFYLSPMSSDAPADSAKNWFVNTMPSASAAIVYNVPGPEKTIIAGKSSGAYGHMLQLNYNDNYLRILRYYAGSWKTTDWEKISAGYADSAGNADTVDGLHVHGGRNNEANKIVRTDTNGYILAGWINTTSGDMGTTAATRVYCSNDAYIRYKTLANFSSDIAGQLYWANVKVSTSSNTATSPTFGSLWINNSYFFKLSGTTFTCQGGTTFTLPSSNINTSTALLWTTASDGTRDTGIFYNSSDFAFIANSNDHGAVFAVYDTDVTQDFEAGAREISVPGSGGALWARGGFSKNGSSDSYILLGGGGHKSLSDLQSGYDSRYVNITGDTMTGALNFANNTWNKIGDDAYIGDCNKGGMIGIKATNTTYPGIAFFNNENTHLGNLIAYNNNIKYRTYSLQFLDNGNTNVSAGTWMNPFSTYNASEVADGQAICVWGQSSSLSNLAADSGDMSLWLKRVSAKGATLNMVLDGEYYANGNLRLAHVSEIPTSLKNPYTLTISLNGTSQGPYDGSAAKNINITPSSIGAATSGHNHDGRYVYNYGGTQMDGASINKNALGMTTTSGISGDWWHILQAAWNDEYRWNSLIAFPTLNRNGVYYRSGLDDNTAWGAWIKLLDANNYSSILDSRYYTESEVNNLLANKLNTFVFNWTNLPGKLVAGNEFNIVNAGFNSKMWFNYLPINDRSKTATIIGYHFGNGATGYTSIKASGFIKNGSSSSYVLLGDGGHKAISDFATSNHNHDSFYVKYAKVAKSTADSANAKPYIYNIENEAVISGYYNYWYILNLGQFSGGNFGTLLAMPYQDSLADSELFIRSAKSGSWRTWRRILHDNNYTSYTVKKDGTGASGTWGINISGNAATATKLQTPRTLWGQLFDGTSNVSGNISGTYFHIKDRASNPYFLFIDSSNQISYLQLLPQNKGIAIGSTESKSLIVNLSGNVGIGTSNPLYKLDINGNIWCRGALKVGSSATNNYIAFYGAAGDAPGSFATSFIGEHLWGGDESSELLFMKFNDAGNGINGTTVSGPGPDRIRHIAHAHVFQIMTNSSYGDFATMAATTAVETKLNITRNRITANVPLYLLGELYNGNCAIQMNNSDIRGLNAIYTSDLADSAGEGYHFYRSDGNYDSIWCQNGTFYFSPGVNGSGGGGTNYTIWHSGNFSPSSYLPLSGGTMTGSIILKSGTSPDMTYTGNVHPYIRFDNVDSTLNVSLIFTDYDAYRSPAGIKLIGNQGNEWFEVIGAIYAAHFYENSDIRYKKILKNLLIDSNTIANLPLFDFEWIENNVIGTGTSALAVQEILPNIVSGTDKLTLDYGVLGTIAGITACKELVKVNNEIFTLKSELLQLKEKVKLLEDKLLKYENIQL